MPFNVTSKDAASEDWIALLLAAIAAGDLTEPDRQILLQRELADPARATALNSGSLLAIEQRFARLQEVWPLRSNFPALDDHRLLMLLWELWLPLAIDLAAAKQQQDRPLIQGILGGQGTGKTTLCAVLQLILQQLGQRVVRLSIDDLYKPYADRQQLRQVQPVLIWRGPPGTHDVQLGMEVLNQIRSQQATALPSFDKSLHDGEGDRVAPVLVPGGTVDILLFEGWFVGVRPIDPALLNQAPLPIQTDADRQFAQLSNQQLQAYVPLWDLLDRLWLLDPIDYRLSQQWRRQAEQQMKAAGKAGMSDQTIDRFVEYYWKALHPVLFVEPLRDRPDRVDLVIEIQRDHQPGRIYRAGDRASRLDSEAD